jgi:uncharacterized protein YjbJ (UPF0337 family)
MAGKTDQIKGKAKEAVGDLTGNKDLKLLGALGNAVAGRRHF